MRTLTDVLKESYGTLSKHYGYFCTEITRYKDNDDEKYELTFTWTRIGPIRSFTYSFADDRVSIDYDHGTTGIYTVDELAAISDFVGWLSHARADEVSLLRFIDYLAQGGKKDDNA